MFYLPKKIKVGFQKRQGTYTGQLAYIIYFDDAGVLRKEKSWESWRSKEIDPLEFNNVPTSGFVLNKKVGGYKSSWNFRNAYVRVYDPRGFEFEITVENLMYILENNDCIKGKGLDGEFIYAWDKTNLVLIPVNSQDYIDSTQFTSVQSNKVTKKDMVVGKTYQSKKTLEPLLLVEQKSKCFKFLNTDRSVLHKMSNLNQISGIIDDNIPSDFDKIRENVITKETITGSYYEDIRSISILQYPKEHTWSKVMLDRVNKQIIFLSYYTAPRLNNKPYINYVSAVIKYNDRINSFVVKKYKSNGINTINSFFGISQPLDIEIDNSSEIFINSILFCNDNLNIPECYSSKYWIENAKQYHNAELIRVNEEEFK